MSDQGGVGSVSKAEATLTHPSARDSSPRAHPASQAGLRGLSSPTRHCSWVGIDDGCVDAADLNPELSGKTLDARITSVGTAYLHLHVNHEEWDEFTFRLPLVLA